ncbi:MAG: hypothetical protein M3Z17_09060 [Gemmatimonadota bacterium]|nr:hypothetical protein [Gemmatimonadota bacterium]
MKRLLIAVAVVAAACGSNKRATETRGWSDHYAFRVIPEVVPPRALEPIHFRVVVQDKTTGQPIETGEGRMFATSKDGASTNDGFTKEKEVGTYSAKLFFPVTGDWAIALQFRREKDPHLPLERIDWIQAVVDPTPPGK